MNNKRIGHTGIKRTLLVIGLYASLPLFILNTNPERLPLPLLLVPFLLIFAGLFLAIHYIGSRTPLLKGLDYRRSYAISGLLTAVPLLLLVFQSMHQLTVRDAVIALGLVLATTFYVSRADFLR